MPDAPQIILLHGNDELAITTEIEKRCEGLGDPATADMNIARFDARAGLDFETFSSAINAAPFLAPRRVVVLMRPVSLLTSIQARKKYLGVVLNAPPTTNIILAEFEELKDVGKGDKKEKHWLLKWAVQAGARISSHLYNLPAKFEMPRWIEKETKKQGGLIEPAAAAMLAERVGEDTRFAAQELTKLLSYVNFERPISLLDVESVSIVSAQGSIFDMVDALGQRDGKKAQHIFHQLLEDGDAMEFWGMVIRQFRLLIQARELLDENAGSWEIQKTLGVPSFVVPKMINQAKKFSMPALEAIHHKLLEIDEGAKTGKVPLDVAIDTLIVELTRQN
jgi:DNA polymerase-3 subunit delta